MAPRQMLNFLRRTKEIFSLLFYLIAFIFQGKFLVYTRVRLSFSRIRKQIVKYFAGSVHKILHSEMSSSSGSCLRLKCLESLGSEENVPGNGCIHAIQLPSEQRVPV